MPVLNPKALFAERVAAIREAHLDAGIKRAELDLSGGIDSAVMAGILVEALGPENVTLVHSMLSTSGEQTRRAEALAEGLGCRLVVGQFSGGFNVLLSEMRRGLVAAGYDLSEIDARCDNDPTIMGSFRSTLRAPIGRMLNRLTGGGLRHGTGNEDEDRVLRYYQKGGDGEVDSNPIAFLSKGEVYQLALCEAQHFDAKVKAQIIADFPQGSTYLSSLKGAADLLDSEVKTAFLDIIRAMPSADLWGVGDKHTDESELVKWLGCPFTYSRIDLDTGEYKSVGTIERINRFLDEAIPDAPGCASGQPWQESLLFSENLSQDNMGRLQAAAADSKAFAGAGLTQNDFLLLLRGARKAEKQTRHKLNPNIPTYGDRAALVASGILTDDLPVLVTHTVQETARTAEPQVA